MRVLFAASPAIAVPCLRLLMRADPDWTLVALLTNPPAPRGRHGEALPSDVAQALLAATAARGPDQAAVAAAQAVVAPDQAAAQVAGLPAILWPEKLDAAAREAVARLKPELLVSFAYGKIFGPRFLSLFPMGGINIHPSLLPRWRGATPIPAAILNRDAETGISIQTLAPEMDSGDILARSHFGLDGRETTSSLSARVAEEAPALLEGVLRRIAQGGVAGEKQDPAAVTFCPLIAKEDGLVDWSRSALCIDAMVRAYDPWPIAHTTWESQGLAILESAVFEGDIPPCPVPAGAAMDTTRPAGTVLGVDKRRGILVQTGDGVLCVRRLQLQARKALDWQAFANGTRNFIGSTLGSAPVRPVAD